jgi:mannosyltransferase
MRTSRLISFHLFPVVVPGFGALLLIFSLMGLARSRPWSAPGATTPGRRTRNRYSTTWRLHGRSPTLRLTLAIAAIVPPLTVLLISTVKPLWMPRYLMWSSAPFFVLVGLGVVSLPAPRWRTGAAAAVVMLAAINLGPYYHAETKPRWDLAAADLMKVVEPGDMVLVPDRGPIEMMNFFLRREDQSIPTGIWTRDVFAAAAHLQEGGRVWVVAGKVGQADHTSRKSFEKIVTPLGQPVQTLHAGDLITFELYDRAPDDNLVAGRF